MYFLYILGFSEFPAFIFCPQNGSAQATIDRQNPPPPEVPISNQGRAVSTRTDTREKANRFGPGTTPNSPLGTTEAMRLDVHIMNIQTPQPNSRLGQGRKPPQGEGDSASVHPRNETDPCDRRGTRRRIRIGNLQSNQPARLPTAETWTKAPQRIHVESDHDSKTVSGDFCVPRPQRLNSLRKGLQAPPRVRADQAAPFLVLP